MKPLTKNLILLVLMLSSVVLSVALRPTISVADELPPIDLAAMVPTTFGDWVEESSVVAQVVNPQQREMLDTIYSQTLSRTYVNRQGYRVMLSLAYGKNQSGSLQLHKPEICYPAQGFTLLANRRIKLDLLGKPISAVQIDTSLGRRREPVTYWTVVGDYVDKGGLDKRWIEMRYVLKHRIPDGMLVRMSSIDQDIPNAYVVQTQFANAMVSAIAPEHRSRFAGNQAISQIPH